MTFFRILGNLISILALSKFMIEKGHATTAFVISLCVANLMFSAEHFPLTANSYFHEEWVLGNALCQIYAFFSYSMVTVSLFSMMAVAINQLVYSNYKAIIICFYIILFYINQKYKNYFTIHILVYHVKLVL